MPGEVDYCIGQRFWQKGHYDDAMDMFERAASWGSKPAQYSLGLIYFNGRHTEVNHPLGIAWLTLATERHNEDEMQRVAGSAIHAATPEERRVAGTLYHQMLGTYGDRHAANRAQRQYDRMVRPLVSGRSTHMQLCIAGVTGSSNLGGPSAPLEPATTAQPVQPQHFDAPAQQDHAPSPGKETNASDPGCPIADASIVKLNALADAYFDGWNPYVSIGALQPVDRSGK